MDTVIPDDVVRLVRDRQGLLWVCQRYDLMPGEKPHGYDLPEGEAAIRYRKAPDETDRRLASIYWEAVWLEGPGSPVLTALRQEQDSQPPDHRRSIVLLASEADSRARVASQEFLPVCSLSGLLGADAGPGARYGAVRKRIRERIAWDLAGRLRDYAGRLLVVVGARDEGDLERLIEVLEDHPLTDLRILLVWPPGEMPTVLPESPALRFTVWPGTEERLAAALLERGAPTARELPKWALRVGRHTIELSARDVHRVLRRFALITERDLALPAELGLGDLISFFEGDLDNWVAYGSGLPISRSYRSEEGRTLWEEVKAALARVNRNGALRTFVLWLPCEPGAGATTLLRDAAYNAAAAGYPTLVLRPEQVNLDLEDLHAFAGDLAGTAAKAGIEPGKVPPLAVFLDVEHAGLGNAGQLAQALAAHGRRAVIVQAVPVAEGNRSERRGKRSAQVRPLTARADSEEVACCAKEFEVLVDRWRLPVSVPSLGEWFSYEKATQWPDQSESMFWVALRFFLTEGMDFSDADQSRDALGQWIQRRAARIEDEEMMRVVQFIAVLSSFRIAGPLCTVLRPVTGGVFTSKILTAINQLTGVVTWGDYQEELEDQVLRFLHPAQADEYLRQQGVRSLPQKLGAIAQMLASLSAGHAGDVWVAESLASNVLSPTYEERRETEWECRLQAFGQMPPLVRDQSKVVLHHWARCLYLSADEHASPHMPEDERRSRLEHAIDKLTKAAAMPRRRVRGEHPSHLYNTLGTAYVRYASFLNTVVGDADGAEAAWGAACRAFGEAILLSGGTNMDALLAFSRRLLSHAKADGGEEGVTSEGQASDIAQSLYLLDQAEELVEQSASPNPDWEFTIAEYRGAALACLGTGKAREYIARLTESINPELGYYCEARLALSRGSEVTGLLGALEHLETAEKEGVALGWRSRLLQISLMSRYPPTQYDFQRLRRLHEVLERDAGYTQRPWDRFKHAVLCYQAGEFAEGAERFRRLREQIRGLGNVPPSLHDFWRDPNDPGRPRLTRVRLDRITTEWSAKGYVDDLRQTVRLRPRHFTPLPKVKEVRECIITFGPWGPLAVPPRFIR